MKTERNKFEFEKKPGYIQRGVVALRDADGNFLPAVPFYEKITPAIKKGEQQLVKDAAELFAEVIENFGKVEKDMRRENRRGKSK